MDFFSTDKKSAFEAKQDAQGIAFGPVVFQVSRALRNLGILKNIQEAGPAGTSIEKITRDLHLPVYGVRVLLESGLSIGLILNKEDQYSLTKTGHFILHDPLTRTNMDFVHDVCYKGLFSLQESIKTGKPAGLKEFGDWNSIYEGLSALPEQIQESWFNFDHFFSDDAFPMVLPLVYKNGVKKLLDIGGNTGKWAVASVNYAEDIQIRIIDLPGQLNVAVSRIADLGLADRISFSAANVLHEQTKFPKGFDAIWMSQFLDCFSEAEIVSILKKCGEALGEEGCVYIMEPFWDLQKYEVAAFCLHQTSIYFTAIANGNSQMYGSKTFFQCIEKAGFIIVEQVDNIGLSQTLLTCKKHTITFE